MARDPVTPPDLRGVFAVPPLPRRTDAHRTLDFDEAERVARHIAQGGVSRFLYGGNAFLYHVSLAEYESLLDWLAGFPADRWAIPSLGPSFGRAVDQCALLRRHSFRCAMMLPCGDPRDASGLEAGIREIADAAGLPLVLYLKSEDGFGSDFERGLDAVGRLVGDGTCVAVKYAVVRQDPAQDSYLDGLLEAGRSRARGQRHRRAAGRRAPPRLRPRGHDHRLRLPRARASPRLSSTRATRETGRGPKRSGPTSSRTKTCGTAGGPRASSTRRRSSRASRRPGPFPPSSRP